MNDKHPAPTFFGGVSFEGCFFFFVNEDGLIDVFLMIVLVFLVGAAVHACWDNIC